MKIHWIYLRFDISVEYAIPVHVIDSFKHLIHIVFDASFRQVMPSALDSLIHVHVHQLKDKSQATCRFIAIKSTKDYLTLCNV